MNTRLRSGVAATVFVKQCHNVAEVQRMSTQGYVLGPTEGQTSHSECCSISIKVDPAGVPHNIALEHSRCRSVGDRVHQHEEADEVLLVLEGAGFGLLGDDELPVERSAIYIPKGIWHGIEIQQ